MAPPRIAYYFASQHVDSGSPKALIGLIDLLDQRRVAPLFLATGEGPLIQVLEGKGVEIIRWPKAESVQIEHPFDGFARVRRHMKLLAQHRVELLHVNELGWNYDLVLAAWLRRIPVVLHVHLPDTIHPRNFHRFAATRVLLVSEAQKRAIGNFDLIADKTEVMYNAADLPKYAGGHAIRAELGLADDAIVVGTLAQLRKGKGIDVLLGAARELIPRYPTLVFVEAGRLGDGEEEFGRRMMTEAQSPEYDGRFRFLGSRQDVPDLLATFDVFVLPTLAETFGIAIVEAMAAGVPVISTRIGPIEEIVNSPAVGALIDTVDVPSLAQAIERMITLPDRGRSIGARGRDSLAGRFDATSLSRRIHEIYDRILAGK